MARTALDALLGRLLFDGVEAELLGGLNFAGFAVTEADGYYSVTAPNSADGSIALAKLANAIAQYDFVMRKTAGAGPWERGTRADLVAAIDGQHVATSLGAPFIAVGSSGGTYPNAGGLRFKGAGLSSAPVTLLTGIGADGTTTFPLIRWGTFADDTLVLGTGGASGIAGVMLRAKTSFSVVLYDGTADRTFSATAVGGAVDVAGVGKLNGASVAAPTQGNAITTTATINVANGAKYDVSSAGGAYTITLGTSGTPLDGEMVTLRCTAALASDITVANGGTGGGNLGPSGKMAAGTKGEYYYYYDGTATAWKYGGYQRCQ